MRLPRLSAVLMIMLMSWITPVQAEQFQSFDHYEVHFNAFNSSFLPPEVAKAYNLQRSKYRALLNVAVLDTNGGDKQPVTAMVKGQLKNLLSQVQELEFAEVREGDAVYYIASFRFTDDEILAFNVSVQPDPNQPAFEVNFKQHFYAD